MLKEKLRRIVGLTVTAAIMASTVTTAVVFAEGETATVPPAGTVLYTNDYTGGFNAILNSYDEVAYTGVTKREKAGTYGKISYRTGEWNGNDDDYLVMKDSAGPGSSSGVNSKLSYIFDEPISSGILSYSFDVGRGERTMAGGSSDYSMVNLNTFSKDGTSENKWPQYVLYIETQKTGENSDVPDGYFRYPDKGLGGYGASERVGSYKVGEIHHVQQVIDFDSHKAYTYLDNQLINTTDISSDYYVKDINFKMSKITGYFDNLDIRMLESVPVFELNTKPIYVFSNKNTVDIAFEGNDIDAANCKAENFTVKDANGNELAISGVSSSGTTATLTFAQNIPAGRYTVEVNGVKSTDLAASGTVNVISSVAASEITNKTTLYYDDFSSYTTDLNNTKVETEYADITYGTGSFNVSPVDGGIGLGSTATTSNKACYVYALKETLTKGVFTYSFDVSRKDSDDNVKAGTSNENNASYVICNLTDVTKWWQWIPTQLSLRKSRKEADGTLVTNSPCIMGPDDGVYDDYYTGEPYLPYNKNQVYHIEQRVDLDRDLIYTYVDGVQLGAPKPFTGDMSSVTIMFTNMTRYFDNFKVEYEPSVADTEVISFVRNGATVTAQIRNNASTSLKAVLLAGNFAEDRLTDNAVLDKEFTVNDTAKSELASGEIGELTVSCNSADGVRAFLWDGLDTMKPLADAIK